MSNQPETIDAASLAVLLDAMPGIREPCAGCETLVELRGAVERNGQVYCKEECADRSCAQLVKRTIKGETYCGIDV